MKPEEIRAVSAVVLHDGRFLLVRRGRPPAEGFYAFPGGRIEEGETAEQAVIREVREETGLVASSPRLLREISLPVPEKDMIFRLSVFRATVRSGEPTAGDDASEAGWFALEQIRLLPITNSTLDIVEELSMAGSR
ncbi:NUDIX hydrolase [Nitratireductor sp. ZSWI3]|uniref:NUDIX hydrolase n=1 Tax=Nitratireductor sp. ZSWI3 TaxID=2966359 RepID=UPI00214FA66C|nr:NUDIX domain-containing protein [Nitratireductor sp. ZSWI3]MCR4266883.1 NUDIX domain-containing protein [Nitratireductor sp. ZSWI3]